MKKFLFLLLPLLVIGCASTPSAKSSKKLTIDEKYINISNSFLIQFQDKNFEACYNRMNETYRQIYTEQEFIQMCNDFWPENQEISSTKVTTNPDQGDFYSLAKLSIDFAKESKVITLAFTATENFPAHIMFYEYKNSAADSLQDLASDNFKIGTGMTGYNSQTSAFRCPGYAPLTAKEFSSVTSTNLMKPSSLMIQRRSMMNYKEGNPAPFLDYSNVDELLSWAKDNNVQVRGHTLVWHTQTPDWFFKEGYESNGELVDRETMIERTDLYIKNYMEYCQENYPGVVYCWDVVNEAVDPSQGDTDSFFHCRKVNDKEKNLWYYTIGADYPEVAFTIARKYAAPGVKLFYNDYGTTDTTKRSYIYKLCDYLNQKGLIDGIGMQSYWDLRNPPMRIIKETINTYAQLGLEIQLTEWSMPVQQENEIDFLQQAERYASIFRLLQKLDTENGGNANITCVSFFGLCDHYPLYPNDTNNTRLWDGKLKPKPVYYAVKDSLNFIE